ncbi:hypothetical protein DL766_003387 [Monosporascus sp. MC13-8B]|uniref:Major facilitator superfamily (MFS) profile domain-containing protein n=1 Tax=Monosporascus cannonballus TaxID=155416 RepID=A0ABY0H6G9_9PEZI|nr:hypothetical protein DL762_006389 [Monosporascus cannonballus]RYO89064.1 hypothetical protein DL763_005774 [Monosporascus cannonballus]RYP33551.1 hypothetical protein DL766_003387 [Monosporascus sp. MC13-8B]
MANKGSDLPCALYWRSNTVFILATVAVGLFTDLFLYGLVVPVLPFMLRERLAIPEQEIQSYVGGLLAAYAGASVLFALAAGWVAARTNARQAPFLSGLAALLVATVMLAFGQSIALIIVARVLQGISAAVVWTVGLAMVLDTIGPGNLGKVFGSIFSFISVGELMAPVLGGGCAVRKDGLRRHLRGGIRDLGIGFSHAAPDHREEYGRERGARDEECDCTASEADPLLPRNDEDAFKIRDEPGRLVRALPILVCFCNPRFVVGLALAFVQASLLAMFDATIPTEADELFGFSSLQAGLLFITTNIPYLVLGPVAGWAVDRYGTKPAAVIGFTYLVPTLVLLRLPSDQLLEGSRNVILYSAILALNGLGLAIIGSPSVVEVSDVVQKYDKTNPEFFGKNGPYAQLYGFNSVFFNLGLTVGPLVAGGLRDSIGYGSMNLTFAIVSGVTAILSFFFIGGKPPNMRGMRKPGVTCR